MGGGRRNRKRKPPRRAPWREPKPRILCVCEGEVTEPDYLDGFRQSVRNPRVEIEVAGGQGVPRSLVEEAKRRKHAAEKEARRHGDQNLIFDEVWCVGDVDDHPKLHEARDMANANGIKMAISNPAIELWLLLHHREQPGAQHRDDVTRLLRHHVPGYDKHVDFGLYADKYDVAKSRAERLEQDAAAVDEKGRNPTTGFWRLTESIRGKDDEEPKEDSETPEDKKPTNDDHNESAEEEA